MKICMKWVVPLGLLIVLGFGPAQAGEYTLEELYLIGMQKSEKVKISGENVEIADSGKYKALSALLPKATAFGAGTQFSGKGRLPPEPSSSHTLRGTGGFASTRPCR